MNWCGSVYRSNVTGANFTAVREGVWVAERPFVWNNIDVGSRAVLVQLADGSGWIHSPIEPDNLTVEGVKDLLEVRY